MPNHIHVDSDNDPLLVIGNLGERGSDIVSSKVNLKAKPQNIGSQDKK